MDLRVIGCHGGETPRHRTSAFLLDDRVAIDAGSLTSGMDLEAQCRLEAVLVSHAHLDHIRDLATIADNRAQNGSKPLVVCGIKPTIDLLKKHFFNGKLWPDFTTIPTASKPTIVYQVLKPEVPAKVAGFTVRAILVSHTIDCSAFVIEYGRKKTSAAAHKAGAGPGTGHGAIAYSGDTGPTKRFWEVLNELDGLRALLMEVSFPNAQQKLATVSGHHTPQTLGPELAKYNNPKDLATLLYHMKPTFQGEVERECAKLKGLNLTVLNLGDHFIL